MNAQADPYKIKQATPADMQFIVELARELYPERMSDPYNVERGIKWLARVMVDEDHIVLLGPNSAGCAHVIQHYGFERRARLDMLACRPLPGFAMEPVKMLRIMLWWAKTRGASGYFRLDADTGVDFAPFAARLGGEPVQATWYKIPL